MQDGHFFVRLESARGIAALTVAAMHSMTFFSPMETSDAATVALRHFLNGQGAVNFFFVLSGFVLGASVARCLATRSSIGGFFISRLFRIYPAIIATVIIYASIFWIFGPTATFWNGDVTFSRLLANATLLDVSFNGMMWSLQVEVLAIPLIVVLGFAERRFGALVILAAVAILFALAFTSQWSIGKVSLVPLFGFALGMLARHWEPLLLQFKPIFIATIFLLAFIAFESARIVLAPSTAGYRWITIIECISSSIFVATIAFALRQPLRFLEHSLLRFFGRISYSFYLTHPMTLMVLAMFASPGSATGLPAALAMIVLVLAITTVIAWVFWAGTERPGIRLGRIMQMQQGRSAFP